MGSTFSGLMFYNKDKRDIQSIQDTISGFTFQLGLRPVNPGEEAAKTLRYFVDEAGGWITISGDVFEFENLKQSKKICGLLSQMAKSPALAYGVFDSDVCIIDFCNSESGKSDQIVMDEGYAYQEEFGYSIKSTRGKYSVWQSIFPNLKKEEFNAVVSGEHIFEEDQLREFLALLNTGIPDEESVDYQTLSLTYREGFKPDIEIIKTGLPVFHAEARQSYIETNTSNSGGYMSFVNRGGPSTGVILNLESNDFEDNPLELFDVTVRRLSRFDLPDDGCRVPYEVYYQSSFQLINENGKWIYSARFEDFPIPEGIICNKYNKKIFWIESDRHFTFYFKIKSKPGFQTEANVECIPINNPENGKFVYPQPVIIITEEELRKKWGY